jgi:hypothetical protein
MYQGVPPTVDREFVKDLKEFNKDLWVEFSREHERFIIYQKSKQYGTAEVMIIETEDGEFRQPNFTDIGLLYWGDLWRHGGVEARMIFGEDKALQKMENDDKKAEESLREATLDDKYTLRNGLLKAMGMPVTPHVRRIEHTPKGVIIEDKRKFNRDQINP